MVADNLRELRRRHPNGVRLLSGDGGIDCSANPAEQELMTAHLHYCEAVSALVALAPGTSRAFIHVLWH